jgi:hypothetical protein
MVHSPRSFMNTSLIWILPQSANFVYEIRQIFAIEAIKARGNVNGFLKFENSIHWACFPALGHL